MNPLKQMFFFVLCTRYISIQLEARTPTRRCDFPKCVGVTWSVNLRLGTVDVSYLTWSCGFSNCIRPRAVNLVCPRALYKVNCVPCLSSSRQGPLRLSFPCKRSHFYRNSLINPKYFGMETSKVSRVVLNAITWSSYVK